MPFADIDKVPVDVGRDYEDRILVAADVEALALSYGVELGTVVFPDYLAVRILLVAGLLDVLLAAPVGFGLEGDP